MMKYASLLVGLACSVLFAQTTNAQTATVSISISNNAWQVFNPSNRPVNVVFATPQGVAFYGASFGVSPGGTMPVMGNINQPYRWFACYAPSNATDLGTGGTPNYSSTNVACR
jgi:hypothetical protein